MDKQATARYWPGRVSSAGTIKMISLPIPFGVALKHIEKAFLNEGFELFHRVAVSELIKRRIGAEVDPVEMLLLIHPVLAFEALLTGDDASVLVPLIIMIKASSDDSCIVVFRTFPQEAEDSDNPLTCRVAEQSQIRLTRAIGQLTLAA